MTPRVPYHPDASGSLPISLESSALDDAQPLSSVDQAWRVRTRRPACPFPSSVSVLRRIARRMVLHKMTAMKEYEDYLRRDPTEVEALFQDVLISVTTFFRDPESFDALAATVFPKLLAGRTHQDPVRIWTLGCSTGEEAYSLAMVFAECAEAAGGDVEPVIALALEDVLTDAGFQIAGVVRKLDKAIELIESGSCDAAIVDANLAGVSASPAAIALAARGLPFIMMSGYSKEQIQGEYPRAVFLSKPCRPELLIETLNSILLRGQN